MRIHKAANVMPLMNEEEFSALKNGIKKDGQLTPIILFEGKILDGRHRYKACRELKIEPIFSDEEFSGNPYQYVWSVNGQRRHLTDTQKAFAILEVGVRL